MQPGSEVRRCLVTGASSGIGAAIHELLTKTGLYTVASAQRRGAHSVDFSEVRSRDELMERVYAELDGYVDLLVLNAGESPGGPFEQMPVERLMRVFSVNILGQLPILQAFCRDASAARRPHAIFIGSQAALPGGHATGSAVYASSKGALHCLLGPLVREYAGRIRFNVVAPGDVDTPQIGPNSPIRKRERASVGAGGVLPTRLIEAREVARVVLFVDETPSINGAVINVSDGATSQ